MTKNNKGFSVVELLIVLIIIGVLGAVGFKVATRSKDKKSNNATGSSSQASSNTKAQVSWSFDGSQWKSSGTAPSCSNSLTINSPTSLVKVKGILYPGQYRGGQYKPHGGFKVTDNTNTSVDVTLPEYSKLYKGSRYIEQGETQYLFVFISPCGIMYKFDHLHTLTNKFQKIVDDNFPAAKVDDSRTTNLQKDIWVDKGEKIASAVGFKKTGNTAFDFGVYDLRSKNKISANSKWVSMHSDDNEYAPYAVCWLDLLGADSAKTKALPAVDGISGAISDVCSTSAGNTLTNTVGN